MFECLWLRFRRSCPRDEGRNAKSMCFKKLRELYITFDNLNIIPISYLAVTLLDNLNNTKLLKWVYLLVYVGVVSMIKIIPLRYYFVFQKAQTVKKKFNGKAGNKYMSTKKDLVTQPIFTWSHTLSSDILSKFGKTDISLINNGPFVQELEQN